MAVIVEMNKRFRFGDEAAGAISELGQRLNKWDE
jgi:hypothetical protein